MYHGYRASPKEKTQVQLYGEPIWTNIYQVTVAMRDTVGLQTLRDRGMPTVGDPTMDQTLWNQPQHICITINDMVDYYNRGCNITFKVNQDASTVYGIVNRYLMAWEERLNGSIPEDNTPVNDLIALDQFAQTLYPQVLMFGEPPKRVSSLFIDRLTGGQGMNRMSMVNAIKAANSNEIRPTSDKKEEPTQGHRSLTGFFANSLANGRELWR